MTLNFFFNFWRVNWANYGHMCERIHVREHLCTWCLEMHPLGFVVKRVNLGPSQTWLSTLVLHCLFYDLISLGLSVLMWNGDNDIMQCHGSITWNDLWKGPSVVRCTWSAIGGNYYCCHCGTEHRLDLVDCTAHLAPALDCFLECTMLN